MHQRNLGDQGLASDLLKDRVPVSQSDTAVDLQYIFVRKTARIQHLYVRISQKLHTCM